MTLLEEIVNAKSFIKGFSLYLTTDIKTSHDFATNDKISAFFVVVNPISEPLSDIFFLFLSFIAKLNCRYRRAILSFGTRDRANTI